MVCIAVKSNTDILNIKNKITTFVTLPMEVLTDSSIVIGLYIVFVHYRKQTKPTFVKVIWALLVILCAMNLVKLYAHK